jgi:hypothetical protein
MESFLSWKEEVSVPGWKRKLKRIMERIPDITIGG